MQRKMRRGSGEGDIKSDIQSVIERYYPHIDNLYPEQIQYIEDILAGRDVMVIMPTGKGKSLCYQIPALIWQDSITIVISPLVALMDDQIHELNKSTDTAPVAVRFTDSRYSSDMYNDIIDRKYRLIYMSPETIETVGFRRVFRLIQDKIRMIAVDEAHCVSQWGYSFRRDYLNIQELISNCRKRPVVAALTATATMFTIGDIIKTLQLNIDSETIQSKCLLLGSSLYARDNLHISIKTYDDDKQEQNRMKVVKKQVKKYLSQHKKGVIYCQTVEQVETVAAELAKSLKKADSSIVLGKFYGDMPDVMKSDNLKDYRNGRCALMVCTNAFGMGVNIPDIEYIIHIGLPLSVENYYQEIGRGARGNGYECECTLHYCRTADDIAAQYLLERDNDNSYRAQLVHDRYDKLKAIVGKERTINLSDEVLEDIYEYFLNQDSLSEAYESVSIRERMHLFVNNTYAANEIRKGRYNSYDKTNGNGRHYFGKTQSWVKYDVYDSNGEELADGQLTYFDMIVADAVYTLWLNHAKITPKGIWILLTGDKDISLKRQKADVIRESLNKMSGYCISIKYHDDNFKRYGILRNEETYLHASIHKPSAHSTSSTDTHLICGKFLPFDSELLKKNQYVLTSIPPLYEYAERRYEFLVYTPEMLDMKNCINTSIENMILKMFLLGRISVMPKPANYDYKSRGLSNKINYIDDNGECTFDRLGLEMYPQKEERNVAWDKYSYWRRYDGVCAKIKAIMECFVHSGLIYGYEATAKDKNEKLGGRKGRPTQLIVDVYSNADKIRYGRIKKAEAQKAHEE
jgi:RecQ family ATP-dependent DNA helicase